MSPGVNTQVPIVGASQPDGIQSLETCVPTISKDWKPVKVGDICKLVNGSAFKPSDWSTDGMRIIRIQNLNTPGSPFNHWQGPLDRKVEINTGDVLIAWSGTPGTSFGAHLWNDGHAILNQHIFRVDFTTDAVKPEWFVHAVNETLDELIGRAHGGVGLRHVKKAEVERLSIPLPPPAEQEQIIEVLNSHLASVEKAHAAAEAQLEAARTLPSAYLREVFHETTPLSVRPVPREKIENWKWNYLQDLARLESGHTPSRNHPEWWGGDIPWIALPDIRALDGQVAQKTSENTNPDGIANSAARILPAGTVCLSRTASVGFVTIMGSEMATSQDVVNWVCGDQLHPKFLMYLLMASREYVRGLASGATHQTVYMPTVQTFRVCIPSKQEQVSLSDHLDDKLATSEKSIQLCGENMSAVNALAAAVLRKALSGSS